MITIDNLLCLKWFKCFRFLPGTVVIDPDYEYTEELKKIYLIDRKKVHKFVKRYKEYKSVFSLFTINNCSCICLERMYDVKDNSELGYNIVRALANSNGFIMRR